ncbi:hypothetical protein PGT21_000163 [Puccinia graminis f. sp. tritici]|uniref:Uncharacterized protein n=1 Tax=Puccinia graminis f. sp. tritici TaxID=56615 RepID=A0A5B0NKP0_PUCGR|nr:hypothetical protein PGT21_000163 [Puccinia graminis f. sp. tritici]
MDTFLNTEINLCSIDFGALNFFISAGLIELQSGFSTTTRPYILTNFTAFHPPTKAIFQPLYNMLKISFHLLCFLLIRKCLTMEAGIRKCSTMEAAQPAQGSSLLNKLGELEAKIFASSPGPHSFNLRPAQEVADFQNNNALCSELPESEKAIWYIDEKAIGASSENDSNFYDLYPGQAVAERKDKKSSAQGGFDR